jgi:hypothetical protein
VQVTERVADGVVASPGTSSAPTKTANSSAAATYVATGAGAAGVFHFAWPGSDCWDIYRGETKVTYGCGAAKQALGPGTYTITNGSNIFQPFTVEIRPGFDTHVAYGGVFEFKWAGSDCWDIYRGDKKVTYGCGPGKQALEPGKYTIQSSSAVFLPFDVDIKAGTTTTAQAGGVFEFKWPGSDCWDIYRGDQKVTYGCGSGKQALQAGSYTIMTASNVFTPFDVVLQTGETTSVAKGGVFEFKWPGSDCWDIYRDDKKVTYGCGAGKQALQAGTYTIKPSSAPIFAPFEVRIRDGVTVTAP